ncbi:hypothetical protein N7461_005720 [Penicillium sp. DV-2018c]|nr:hypothetical protein N7461_005720 [Penicillium sp. DV-2018c]
MLSELPAELLLSIASYLDDHTYTLRLASSCCAIHLLLLPTVFASLDLMNYKSGNLNRLVHTLARKPELAQEVRTLSVSHLRLSPDVRYRGYDQETILPVLKSVLGPGESLSTWEYRLKGYDYAACDAWTALLLSLLPNLQDLVLSNISTTCTLKWMARVAQEDSSALSRLRDLTVLCGPPHRDGLGSSHFLPILRLPSLRSFWGSRISDDDTSDDASDGPSDDESDDAFDDASDDPSDDASDDAYDDRRDEDNAFVSTSYLPDNIGYSNVTEIRLMSCYSLRGFTGLVQAPKRLEYFISESDSRNELYTRGPVMLPSRYLPPLSWHREALHTLTLTDAGRHDWLSDYEYIGSLAGFSALKNLRLPTYHILDWDRVSGIGPGWSEGDLRRSKIGFADVLPPSLETLVLDGLEREYTTGVAKALKDLLSGGKYHCPNLIYLEIKAERAHAQQSIPDVFTRPIYIAPMLQEFAEFKLGVEVLCLAAGVDFCFRDMFVEEITKMDRWYEYEFCTSRGTL